MLLPLFYIICQLLPFFVFPPLQVTEREHERMVSELVVKQNEELSQLRTELSLELRENMEAAHQAELQQAQVYKIVHTPTHTFAITHSVTSSTTPWSKISLSCFFLFYFSCPQKCGNYNDFEPNLELNLILSEKGFPMHLPAMCS